MTNLSKLLDKRKIEGNHRSLKPKSGLIDFCSNDYLGFSKSPLLRKNILNVLAESEIPTGATGARLISGNSSELEALEERVAKFHGAEGALIFSTGYLSNLALLSSIGTRNDTFFYDELAHASLKDGMRLSPAKSFSFRHNDLQDLERKLSFRKGVGYVVVEALYSMDGDLAPLKELSDFCESKDLRLIVDEAHTNGIFGENGEGLVSELKLSDKVFARNLTFGKALGIQGGAIAGSNELREFMINYSRPFIYSTAMSPYLVSLISEVYKFLPNAKEERKKLFANINRFRESAGDQFKNEGPVHILCVTGNEAARSKAEYIQSKGFDLRAVLSPTVRKGSERLRICIHSANSEAEILNLSRLLNE